MFRSGTERGSTPRRERPFRRIGQSYRRSHLRTRRPGRACYLARQALGVWHNLTSEITAMDRPAYFQGTMVQGVFRFMKHDHFFRALSADETEMKDVFCFAAPLPVLGRLAEVAFLGRYMQALLRERNAVVKEIAESSKWQEYVA